MYALSEMVDHASMRRAFYVHFLDLAPGMVGLEDPESLVTHPKDKKISTEKLLVRHILAIQQALRMQELGYVNRLPGLGTRRMD